MTEKYQAPDTAELDRVRERLAAAGFVEEEPHIFVLQKGDVRREIHVRLGEGNLLLVRLDPGQERELHVEYGDRLHEVLGAVADHAEEDEVTDEFMGRLRALVPDVVGFGHRR
jgi:hypothetical protein